MTKFIHQRFFKQFAQFTLTFVWVALFSSCIDNHYDIDKINCYSHSNRLLNYRIYDNSWLESAGGRERVNQRVSNNHLIPADKTVKGKLLSIKKGEYVELEGYLVTAYTTDSDSNIYWMSSDTRTDTGDGACEVIYVTDVKWLKQKK